MGNQNPEEKTSMYTERREDTDTVPAQKNVDNSESVLYSKDIDSSPEDLKTQWKTSNSDLLKYAGDKAKESIDKGLDDAYVFMKDADSGTKFQDVQNASVKRQLAIDANDSKLEKLAANEMIGHLSDENKEVYLKNIAPLSDYINTKDKYDYNNGSYTTTKNITQNPDENVRQIQTQLNRMGYTDKFGEPLKEDGIVGGKTLYAFDTFDEDPEYYKLLDEVVAKDMNGNYRIGEPMAYAGGPGGLSNNVTELILGLRKYGRQASLDAKRLSDDAKDLAEEYAMENGFYDTFKKQIGVLGGEVDIKKSRAWDNAADALRHMGWNTMMVWGLNSEQAKYFADNHEIVYLDSLGWVTKIENDVVYTKMNQPTLMDLWNNSVGRTLGADPKITSRDCKKVFDHAVKNNYLLLDADEVYNFYGVLEYVNPSDWTVNVKWDLNTGNITFTKSGLKDITLKVGI